MKKHIVPIILGLFALSSLALVAVGVATHQEAGLLTACPAASTGSAPDYDGACTEIRWDHKAPFSIKAVGGQPWEQKALISSVSWMNHGADFEALRPVTQGDSDIEADFDTPYEVGQHTPAGRVKHDLDASTMRVTKATIYLSNLGTLPAASVAIRHELGHALGLAHDVPIGFSANANSIMTNARLDPQRSYVLSDSDSDLLRRRYHK